jgi:hypothetical protein
MDGLQARRECSEGSEDTEAKECGKEILLADAHHLILSKRPPVQIHMSTFGSLIAPATLRTSFDSGKGCETT